jgi:hypothetical protein
MWVQAIASLMNSFRATVFRGDWSTVMLGRRRAQAVTGAPVAGRTMVWPVTAGNQRMPRAASPVRKATLVTGHVDLDRPCLGQHRLGPVPVAGVPANPAGRIVCAVAEVSLHLTIQRALDDHLGQPPSSPPSPSTVLRRTTLA